MVLPKLYSNLIHPAIQQDKIQFTKAKTLLILLLFFLLVLIGYSSLFILQGALFNTKALLNYGGAIVIASCLFVLKTSPQLKHPLRIVNYTGAILITGGVYLSGGFASNDIFWFLVVGASSMLFISQTDGIIVTIFSTCVIVAFYIIDIYKLIELPSDPFTQSIHYQFINALIIILILFFLIWILVKRNHRLQNVLQETQASQIRESISQDFHDELGNKLASIVHLSKRLKDSKNGEEQQKMLKVIESESQQVYDNFRDFIWTNDPNSLTISSLFIYLTDFNQQFFSPTEIQVDGELFEQDDKGQIPPLVVRHIVPIFKELMTNIYKYSKATRVNWSLKQDKQQLILRVIDNGIGFDYNDRTLGHGLKNIQKRATKLQATYYVKSAMGKGTETVLSVYLNQKEKKFNE